MKDSSTLHLSEPKAPLLAILNRGEIVTRVAHSAKALGFKVLVIYTPNDQSSPHLEVGDYSIDLHRFALFSQILSQSPSQGPNQEFSDLELYLHEALLIKLCIHYNVTHVHPGYGFLSEAPSFAQGLSEAGIKWVGPKPDTMDCIGLKNKAREFVTALGVPCIQGFSQTGANHQEFMLAGQTMEVPLLIKAASGGGGRGMRLVEHHDQLNDSLRRAQREAKLAFGQDDLLLEQYIPNAKHIEVQIFGDEHQQYVHLGERDCSVQRRHQKLIEEAPALSLSPRKLQELYDDALKIAQALDYQSAGTVEFLVSEHGEHYFLEVNTRIQVEHGVSERLYDVDLVDWQLRVALGEALPLTQAEINARRGKEYPYVLELRLCAESPDQHCIPQSGKIIAWQAPQEATRVDHCIGSHVSPYFDSMLAKLIYTGQRREATLERAADSVQKICLLGIKHNGSLLSRILKADGFVKNEHHTQWLSEFFKIQSQATKDQAAQDQNTSSDLSTDTNDHALAHLLLSLPIRSYILGQGSHSTSIWSSSGESRWYNELILESDDATSSINTVSKSLSRADIKVKKAGNNHYFEVSAPNQKQHFFFHPKPSPSLNSITWQDERSIQHQRDLIFVIGDQEAPLSNKDFSDDQMADFMQLWHNALLNARTPPRVYIKSSRVESSQGQWRLFTKMNGLSYLEQEQWLGLNSAQQVKNSVSLEKVDGQHAYILAPINAKVQSLDAELRQEVKAQDSLITLESMKLEYQVSAPKEMTVQEYLVQRGQQVTKGGRLALVQFDF